MKKSKLDRHVFAITVICLGLFNLAPSVLHGTEQVPSLCSWVELDEEFSSLNDLASEEFQQNESFKKLKATRNQELFIEMMGQKELPVVALAGFHCLKECFPQSTLQPALELILRSGVHTIHAEVLEYLQRKHPQKEFARAFSAAISRFPQSEKDYLVLTTVQLSERDN